MSQQPPDNSDPQQPDASSRQQADGSTPQNVVQGNQNRVVQGNDNQAVLGDGNTVVQGNNNLMFVVKELIFGQQLAPVGNPAREHNQRLLLADVKQEVTARLRQSLHNAVLINLGKESQPQQVKRPWDAEIKIGLKPAVPLPHTTTILEVFDSQEIAGKLLILGAPGSGKTTTQLELAQALVSRAEKQPDYPVPVLFNLSSWKDDRQSLTDWLVAELKSKYGVSIKLGKEWVDNKQLLPLLDGLDELEPQRQESCVRAINQFLAGENRPLSLVVCSRSEEYSNYSTQLQLNGAIYLQHLSNRQICDYLTSMNYIELWSTISCDLDLLELLKTPFLLSITVLASQEISIEEWKHLSFTADRIQYLLDAYIGRMLTRDINSRAYLKNKPPNAKQTRIWLVWLAQQIGEYETEFTVENIVDSWITKIMFTINYKPVEMFSRLVLRFISGVIYIPLYGLMVVNILPIYPWLFHLIFIQQFFVWDKRIYLHTTLVAPEKFYDHQTYNYDISFNKAIWITVVYSVYFGMIGGIISGIISGIINGLFLGISGLISGVFSGVFSGLISGLINGIFSGLISGLILGLITGTGTCCVIHFNKRLFMYLNSYTPWNYARFLNYCTERLFLQRVGGRYRFIHKLLQDHFAQMEFKRD